MSDNISPKNQISDESRKTHRRFAVDCFNKTWDLLDKPNRSSLEDIEMIHTAHASRYHWGLIGSPLEFARGDWQISRVYAVLGIGNEALRYAQSSLEYCLENNIGDFDLAFAYEALARAKAVLGDEAGQIKYKELAHKSGKAIQKAEDRSYFLSEIESI